MSYAASPPPSPEPTIGELVAGMTADFGTLVRKELELAKAEVREEAKTSGKAVGMFGAAGVAGWFALLFVSFALAWGLAEIMPTGFAFLLVGLLYAAVAAFVAMQAKERMRTVRPPQNTIETVKEDVAWARARMS
jgi:cobalamin biosynthesis protein CobD/CbiB